MQSHKATSCKLLLTYGPPHEIMDATLSGHHPGCKSLARRLAAGELRPRLHVFGHIHEAHGAQIQGDTVFTHAANWPMGPRAKERETRPEFGAVPGCGRRSA
ncbi:hypothetical protein B0H10DRAFT_2219565 [Mycena sp. CBHHK59/15]|nr:hypothetical protein B0H10DRAFT_2219565 [Mycena sp. CBHHK59/15]